MIGNDVVDLQVASRESNWRRKGYLLKVFATAERQMITRSKEPDTLVWLLWSMKEAAYKINSRMTGTRSFAPASLLCQNVVIDDGFATGIVLYNKKIYFTESELNSTHIHTIAAPSQSRLSTISKEFYQYPGNNFDYHLKNPACVSHHGAYLALIF